MTQYTTTATQTTTNNPQLPILTTFSFSRNLPASSISTPSSTTSPFSQGIDLDLSTNIVPSASPIIFTSSGEVVTSIPTVDPPDYIILTSPSTESPSSAATCIPDERSLSRGSIISISTTVGTASILLFFGFLFFLVRRSKRKARSHQLAQCYQEKEVAASCATIGKKVSAQWPGHSYPIDTEDRIDVHELAGAEPVELDSRPLSRLSSRLPMRISKFLKRGLEKESEPGRERGGRAGV
ncbi:hypothetical protein MMC20_006804 [Loxospora ochrophaea]|nr:hypothetical protein [Loxospora ochrophaea]